MIATAGGEKTVSSTMSKTLNTYQIVFRHPTLGEYQGLVESENEIDEIKMDIRKSIQGDEPVTGLTGKSGQESVIFSHKIASEGIWVVEQIMVPVKWRTEP